MIERTKRNKKYHIPLKMYSKFSVFDLIDLKEMQQSGSNFTIGCCKLKCIIIKQL